MISKEEFIEKIREQKLSICVAGFEADIILLPSLVNLIDDIWDNEEEND